jgi:hypothetical protein
LYHDGTADPDDLWTGRLNLPVVFDDSGKFGVRNMFGGNLSHEGLDGRATYYDFDFNEGLFGFGATYEVRLAGTPIHPPTPWLLVSPILPA